MNKSINKCFQLVGPPSSPFPTKKVVRLCCFQQTRHGFMAPPGPNRQIWCLSPIPNWIKITNWGFEIPNWGYYTQLGIFFCYSSNVVRFVSVSLNPNIHGLPSFQDQQGSFSKSQILSSLDAQQRQGFRHRTGYLEQKFYC